MRKFILGIIFGIYVVIAVGHSLFFVAETKYYCVNKIGFVKGMFWGCDRFFADPVNRFLNDSFFKNFFRGLIWPLHYFSEHSIPEKKIKSIEEKASDLSRYLNKKYSITNSVKNLNTRVELSHLNRFVFEIEWEPNEFKELEKIPVEFFRSQWAAKECSNLAKNSIENSMINEILNYGFILKYQFYAEGFSEKIEVEIESCYPLSYL